jgi:hypothetical protein
MPETLKKKSPSRRTVSPVFQVLSLSGGGYRGLFSASVLEELERRAGRPLRECFDMITGTSIGGIIACGLAAGVSASTIRREFEARGGDIFDRRTRLPFGMSVRLPKPGLFGARYSRAGLAAAVEGALGEAAGMQIGDLPKALVVTAVSATNGQPVVFDSMSSGGFNGATLREVALATSAAPTYFPEFNIRGNSLVDGGIIANAPDAVAVIKAISGFGQRPEEIRMLSIGTAGEAIGEVFRDGRSAGVLKWMIGRNLFGLTVGAQQALAVELTRSLLGDRYLRIDVAPDAARAKAVALDKADKTATATLLELAREALSQADVARGGDLAAFLRHHVGS